MNDSWRETGWPVIRLAEIADLFSGGTPSRKRPELFSGDIPWLTGQDIPEDMVSDIENGRESVGSEAIKSSATRVVPAGTVLMTTRVTVGKIAVAKRPLCFSQDVTGISLRSDQLVTPHFLAHFLLSQRSKFRQRNQGSTIAGITRDNLALEMIPIPSLSEQRRIAKILEEAQHIRKLQRGGRKKLASIIPSLFRARFGDPVRNPNHWEVVPISTLLEEGPKNGIYKPSALYGSGVPIIRIGDFSAGRLTDSKSLQRVRLNEKEVAQFEVRNGDILFNRVNSIEYLGKSLLVSGLNEPTAFESNMMRLRLNRERVVPEYLIEILQNQSVLGLLRVRAKKAVHQASINQGDLLSLNLPLPPLKLLRRFQAEVREVETLFSEELSAMNAVSYLEQSLAQHAFTGQLTTLWRAQHSAVLTQEIIDRDAVLRSVGVSGVDYPGKPTIDLVQSPIDDHGYTELTRDQHRVLGHWRQRNEMEAMTVESVARVFTATEIADTLRGPLQANTQAVESNLAVLVTRGLVIALSREQKAPDTSETCYGNCYRLPVAGPRPDETANSQSLNGDDDARNREILRLLERQESAR